MHPVCMIAWRPARGCVFDLRQVFPVLARSQQHAVRKSDAFLSFTSPICRSLRQNRSAGSLRPFFTAAPLRLHQRSRSQQQIPSRAPSELAFRRTDLRPYEIKVVFGPDAPPPQLANTLLKVLHSRRVNGTLDLDLPSKLASQLKAYPSAVDDALRWLRLEYPVDEDAAILRRIEREEAGEGDEILIHRAENLGLYKPQSGLYGAKLGEEGDIFGESELQRLRKENELKAEQEQREVDEFIEQTQQAHKEKAGALEARREDGLEVSTGSRPPNLYEKWKIRHYLYGTSKITYEEASQTGKIRRLLPSILFAATVTCASYLFALTWTPPDRSGRLLPSLPLAEATIYGIMAANLVILALWRFPPAWRMLNRYFISTPGVATVFSNLGNTFSHHSFTHLLWNAVVLWLVGISLHEDVGRGYFLAMYLSSGVVGSVLSLSNMVLRNVFSSSLGASGAILGVFAAYCTINPSSRITLWLLPEDLARWVSCEASSFLFFVVALEILSMTVPWMRKRGTDYVAHLGGYASGILGGLFWRREHEPNPHSGGGWGKNRPKEPRWYEKFLGR